MILFAYNFPHRKTQDFIFYCHMNDIEVQAVIACDWKKLKISEQKFKTKITVNPLFHPKDICKKLNIDYFNFDHDSNECLNLLTKIKPKIGLISGARILPNSVIKLFEKGIINFHPGDIPKIRGLNSSLRAIKFNHLQVVTAHLIDDKIDSGTILFKSQIEIDVKDTIFDINEKLYNLQILMIEKAINMTNNNKGKKVKLTGKYHHEFPIEVKKEFGINLIDNIKEKYDGILLAVSHRKFSTINIQNFKKDKHSIIFDLKGFFPRNIVDSRL